VAEVVEHRDHHACRRFDAGLRGRHGEWHEWPGLGKVEVGATLAGNTLELLFYPPPGGTETPGPQACQPAPAQARDTIGKEPQIGPVHGFISGCITLPGFLGPNPA
jgi:hypothetical protein